MSRLLPPAASLLPSLPTDVGDRLHAERIVYLAGEIDDAVACRVSAELLLLAADDPDRDITLYLTSPGGSVVAGMAIHDTMQLVSPDVATWAVGLAASTAQLLLTAGAPGKRYALPHARVRLQHPAARLPGSGADLLIEAPVFGAMKDEIAELTARYTGQPVATVVADADRGRWFDAARAREYGLVDHVAGGPGAAPPARRVGFLGEGRGNPRG